MLLLSDMRGRLLKKTGSVQVIILRLLLHFGLRQELVQTLQQEHIIRSQQIQPIHLFLIINLEYLYSQELLLQNLDNII